MVYRFLKKAYFYIFNLKHGTNIKSYNASVHAKYGYNVLIDKNTIISDDVVIGDYSYVNKNSSIENCEIGKYCSISSGVYICPFEHDLTIISTHPSLAKTDTPKRRKVVIENDVLISLNCIILEGVHIGNGAVIGAGAVVTRDVEAYEIVGGIPARHIGYRADLKTRKMLEYLKWWDWKENEVKERKELLQKEIKQLRNEDVKEYIDNQIMIEEK